MARGQALDALRAGAMLWMAAFHLSFDLNFYGLLQPRQNFYADPVWTLQRTCIVSLFLFCAGVGQAWAPHKPLVGAGASRFWRRWGQIAACAVLVSAGSAWMFPRSWISFGVLHGMAVMLLVLRMVRPGAVAVWPLALACLVLPQVASHPLFNETVWRPLGLGTFKPVTEDYVPVLPWLGVMLIGWGVGCRSRWRGEWRWLEPLARFGRWPLSFYMLHQPVLIGSILLYRWLHGG